jgi:hypothetical protein
MQHGTAAEATGKQSAAIKRGMSAIPAVVKIVVKLWSKWADRAGHVGDARVASGALHERHQVPPRVCHATAAYHRPRISRAEIMTE